MIRYNVIMKKKITLLLIVIVPVIVCLGLFFVTRPQPVWIVEDRYLEAWRITLRDSPLQGARLVPLSAARSALRRSWYGYRISSAPVFSGETESPVQIYHGLPGQVKYNDAIPLVIDPWLIFRRHTSPALSREQAESGSGENGRILIATSDRTAITAWAAQLLQESPGVFPPDAHSWEQMEERILQGPYFHRTSNWEDIWPDLLQDAWVYAPLSRIRALPLHETNILAADIFPSRPGWNQFGLQVQIIWAIPFGNKNELESAEAWLTSPSFQTILADTLGWLAVHPESPPFNPVSGNARIAWLTSSYVWTIPQPDN